MPSYIMDILALIVLLGAFCLFGIGNTLRIMLFIAVLYLAFWGVGAILSGIVPLAQR